MSKNIKAFQIKGYGVEGGSVIEKKYQQDTIIAGHSARHIDSPQNMLDLILEVQSAMVEEADKYQEDFETTAEINSIRSDGNGQISIMNGSVGDSSTHVILVDRYEDTAEVLSKGASSGPLWLGDLYQGMNLQSEEESTNEWDVALKHGQELHVVSMSDGIPNEKVSNTVLPHSNKSLIDIVKSYLIETPSEDVNLAQFLANYADELGARDNASVVSQSYTKDSPAGNSILALFDANGGTDDDIALFRENADATIVSERYSGPIEYEPIASLVSQRQGLQEGLSRQGLPNSSPDTEYSHKL